MSKCVLMLGVGLIMGAYLGYANEEEIDEMAHLMHKNQKKMSRKAHRAYRIISIRRWRSRLFARVCM